MRRRLSATALLVCLACGGGSDGGSRTGVSQGAVTATGSVTVTGTLWDTDAAEVVIDGDPGVPADLARGMVVSVRGTRDPSGDAGVAARVEFDDAVQGPVEAGVSVDGDRLELTVLDQRVVAEDGFTIFAGGASFDGIAPGDLVEVSGYRGPGGDITATRIEALPPAAMPPVELKGLVDDLDAVGGEFALGGVAVLYDPTGVTTDLSDLPGGQVFEDDFVEVEGLLSGADEVTALRIELDGQPVAGSIAAFEIEGIVRDFTTVSNPFRVGSQTVLATALGIDFEPNNPSTFMRNGVRIEVEGRLAGGELVADAVFLRDGDARVRAEIAEAIDVDPAAGTLTLLVSDRDACPPAPAPREDPEACLTVRVDGATRLTDERDGLSPFGLGDLTAGDFVALRGVRLADVVLATELSRVDPGPVVVQGRLEAFDATAMPRTFTLLGLRLATGPLTDFGDLPGDPGETGFYQYLGVNVDAVLRATELDGDGTVFDVADEVGLPDGG